MIDLSRENSVISCSGLNEFLCGKKPSRHMAAVLWRFTDVTTFA